MIKKSESRDFSGIFFYGYHLLMQSLGTFMFNRIIYFICHLKGVKLGKKIIFKGIPNINRYPNSSIILGDNCKFNSSNKSLPVRLNHPCTFVTLQEKAEIKFGKNSGASGLKISARTKVTIGDNVLLGAGCTIFDNDAHNANLSKRILNIIPSRPVKIEDNVFIGFQSTILKGVTIGKNSVIGARSVVFNDIPPNCIAVGNPCKVIMKK